MLQVADWTLYQGERDCHAACVVEASSSRRSWPTTGELGWLAKELLKVASIEAFATLDDDVDADPEKRMKGGMFITEAIARRQPEARLPELYQEARDNSRPKAAPSPTNAVQAVRQSALFVRTARSLVPTRAPWGSSCIRNAARSQVRLHLAGLDVVSRRPAGP